MSVTATSGFFPASGNTNVAAGVASGGDKGAAGGPLGLFAALLEIASHLGDEVAPPATPGTGTGNAPTAKKGPAVALGTLIERLTANLEVADPMDAAAATDGMDGTPVPTALADGGEASVAVPADLLGELTKVLEAIGIAAETDAPLDPALEAEAVAVIEALATSLGVPLPPVVADKTLAPAIAGTAAGMVVETPPLPPLYPATDGIPSSPTLDPVEPLPVAAAAKPDGRPQQTAATTPAGTALPPELKELAARLAKLAEVLEPKAPALAERLAALGAKLGSGDVDLSALAATPALTPAPAAEDGTDPSLLLLRLLAIAPDLKTAPGAKPFATPNLDVPVGLGLRRPDAGSADETGHDLPHPRSTPTPQEPADAEDRRIEPRTASNSPAATTDCTEAAARPATPAGAAPPTTPAAAPDTSAQAATNAAAAAAPSAVVSADARAVHAAYSAPVRQINIPQVAFEVTRQVQAGATRFQIRLDPPELGRIDVKLDVDAAGNVNARMTVDRAETLDLMQRDHRALERALAQAGLDSSKTNLEFSLRQNPFSHQEQQQRQGGHDRWSPAPAGAETDNAPQLPPHVITYRGAASPGGVNLFV